MIDCEHQWNWDKPTRFCLQCRQVRVFPTDGSSGKVVWQGLDDKRNPLDLSAEDKSILAHFSRDLGVKKASACIKIETKLLNSWCGAYCRENKPKNLDKAIKSKKGDKLIVSVNVPPKSPLSTEVSKGNLPAFPAFNDTWESPVQLEWLATYLELVKLGNIK